MSTDDDKRRWKKLKSLARADRVRDFLSKVRPISAADDTIEKIVCIRVADAESRTGRSTIEVCEECGQLVWLDPNSRKIAPKATLTCAQCLLAKDKLD